MVEGLDGCTSLFADDAKVAKSDEGKGRGSFKAARMH